MIANGSRGQSLLSSVSAGRCCGSAVLVLAPASSPPIDALTPTRRPSHRPIAAGTTHHPTIEPTRAVLLSTAAERTVIAASAEAAPALSSTVVLRKSTNRTRRPLALEQRLQQGPNPALAVDRDVGLLDELRRRLLRCDRHADGGPKLPPPRDLAQPAECVQVGHVVADVHRANQRLSARLGTLAKQLLHSDALVEADRRPHLQHLASPMHREPLALGG